MKIAVIGVKGIPGVQGGIEKHAEELYPRLADRGHDITVYCRPNHTLKDQEQYNGVKTKVLRSIDTKHLDAITHTFISSLDAARGDYDVIHYHAIGPALLSFIPRITRKAKICVTVHALDWKNEKWGGLAKKALEVGERAAAVFPDKTIVVSKELESYYKSKYKNAAITYIPNGVKPPIKREPNLITSHYSLEKEGYFLYAGRLSPEKGCHLLIPAYRSIRTDKRLVIAGDSSHSESYVSKLKQLAKADDRIIFTGQVSGALLDELFSNAFACVVPSNSEGLPIALLEAISYGIPTLCSDIPANLEVATGHRKERRCLVFEKGNEADLGRKLEYLLQEHEALKDKTARAADIIINEYDWDRISEETEAAYESLFTEAPSSKKERHEELGSTNV